MEKGIYDEGVHDLVLDEQIEQYRDIGLSEEEAVDLILRQEQSNLWYDARNPPTPKNCWRIHE